MRYHGLGVAALLLAGAAASIAGSTAALRLIDNTAISPGGAPRTASEVRRELAHAGRAPGGQQSPPSPRPSASSKPPHSPTQSAPASFTATGGTVFATCSAGKVTLTSWIPAQGYQSDGVSRGPGPTAWVKFKSASGELTVTAACAKDQPRFSTSADDHRGGGGGDDHGGSPGGSGGGGGSGRTGGGGGGGHGGSDG